MLASEALVLPTVATGCWRRGSNSSTRLSHARGARGERNKEKERKEEREGGEEERERKVKREREREKEHSRRDNAIEQKIKEN